MRGIHRLVEACENENESRSGDWEKAREYYDARMDDLKPEEGWSSVVSDDVRQNIRRIMPAICRAFFFGGRIVDYMPVTVGDEQMAEEATDYVQRVVPRNVPVRNALYDAILDALIVKTGILTWEARKSERVLSRQMEGQMPETLLGLAEDPEVSVEVTTQNEDGTLDYVLKRRDTKTDCQLRAVPRENFLIHPDAKTVEDASICGEVFMTTRSDLVAMGYEKDKVYEINVDTSREELWFEGTRQAREGDDYRGLNYDPDELPPEMRPVTTYLVYPKLDLDDDGIAEIYRVHYADSGSGTEMDVASDTSDRFTVLAFDLWDEAPYARVVVEPESHQFEGRSIAEDLVTVQRVKTELLREGLNNLYMQNRNRGFFDRSKLTDAGYKAFINPRFGESIEVNPGEDISAGIFEPIIVPWVGQNTFDMLTYMDEVARARTGITDKSGNADPETFAHMKAEAAKLMTEAGLSVAEMIINVLAQWDGIRMAFRGLLKLLVAHGKVEDSYVDGQWQRYDPSMWNPDMDCEVSVGKGSGTRERDLQILQLVLGLQQALIEQIGADNPFVKPDQLYHTLEKIVEAAGFSDVNAFFTRPDPQKVQELIQKQAQQKDPAVMKVEAQAQADQQKAQLQAQIEREQMEADIKVRQAELVKDAELEKMAAQMRAETELMKAQTTAGSQMDVVEVKARLDQQAAEFEKRLEFLMHEREMNVEREKLAMEMRMAREKLEVERLKVRSAGQNNGS